jgi:hypothetical protein
MKKKCDRCKINIAEIEIDNFYLCNSCDCERLSCLNNTENPKTEEEFFKEIKNEGNN